MSTHRTHTHAKYTHTHTHTPSAHLYCTQTHTHTRHRQTDKLAAPHTKWHTHTHTHTHTNLEEISNFSHERLPKLTCNLPPHWQVLIQCTLPPPPLQPTGPSDPLPPAGWGLGVWLLAWCRARMRSSKGACHGGHERLRDFCAEHLVPRAVVS